MKAGEKPFLREKGFCALHLASLWNKGERPYDAIKALSRFQGLSSYRRLSLAPGSGKMRDPGNEVVYAVVWEHKCDRHNTVHWSLEKRLCYTSQGKYVFRPRGKQWVLVPLHLNVSLGFSSGKPGDGLLGKVMGSWGNIESLGETKFTVSLGPVPGASH